MKLIIAKEQVFTLLLDMVIQFVTLYAMTQETMKSTGWASLGKFYFKQGPARIILDDRGAKNDKEESDFKLNLRRMVNWKNNMNITINTTQIIIADAVKWVKVE